MRPDIALIWIHVAANLFWIGSITAVAWLLVSDTGDSKTRGALARGLYLRLAVPSFAVSTLFGLVRLLMDAGNYLKAPWMHAKLLFVLIIIALHHVIGARAKAMAQRRVEEAKGIRPVAIILALCALAAAFFVVMRVPGG